MLYVNTGTMFGGKTSALLRQGERFLYANKKVVYIKPLLDNRYSEGEIVTHKGVKVEAINVDTALPFITASPEVVLADVILIDEVQFFHPIIVSEVESLLEQGKKVYVSGLDLNFMGDPFNTTMLLMAKADVVEKHNAICGTEGCGNNAVFTYKKDTSLRIVDLGSEDKYVPMCRDCYKKATLGGDCCEDEQLEFNFE